MGHFAKPDSGDGMTSIFTLYFPMAVSCTFTFTAQSEMSCRRMKL